MCNKDLYFQIFKNVFGVEVDETKDLKYKEIDEWDSVGQMELIASIEDEFKISLDMDDMLDLNSVSSGIAILAKYGIII